MKGEVSAPKYGSVAKMWRTRGGFIHDLSTTTRKKSLNFCG
jgi:hypothetical protein